MPDRELLNRITIDPNIMTGKPVIRGTRLTVEYILNLLAHDATVSEILAEYDGLVEADIKAFLYMLDRELIWCLFGGNEVDLLRSRTALN